MKLLTTTLLCMSLLLSTVQAKEYVIDKKGMHASIQFKISHLGYSWLWGRFNDFEGSINYDKNKPAESSVNVTIATASVDSNHALRDKHLRDEDFLDVSKFPKASFVSTSYSESEDGKGILKGDFTLRGVTRNITIQVNKLGEGKDPWGGYRIGFEGITRIALSDYGITKNLGPASRELDIILSVEAKRQ